MILDKVQFPSLGVSLGVSLVATREATHGESYCTVELRRGDTVLVKWECELRKVDRFYSSTKGTMEILEALEEDEEGGALMGEKEDVRDFVQVTCFDCGVEFGLSNGHNRMLRRSLANFYCPNGHALKFPKASSELEGATCQGQGARSPGREGQGHGRRADARGRNLAAHVRRAEEDHLGNDGPARDPRAKTEVRPGPHALP